MRDFLSLGIVMVLVAFLSGMGVHGVYVRDWDPNWVGAGTAVMAYVAAAAYLAWRARRGVRR